jgi:hypothetical protein
MPWDPYHGDDWKPGRGFINPNRDVGLTGMVAGRNVTRTAPSPPPPPAWGAPTTSPPPAPSSSGGVVDDPPRPAEPVITPQQARADARARRRSEEHVERVTSMRALQHRQERETGSLGMTGWAAQILGAGAGGYSTNWLQMEPSRVTQGIGPMGQSRLADAFTARVARTAQTNIDEQAADARFGARVASQYPAEEDDVSGLVSGLRPARSLPYPPKGGQFTPERLGLA